MQLIYNICSYLCNLDTHFYAFDGCKKFGTDLDPVPYDASSSSAEVQCCSMHGQFCHRHNPDTQQCWSGNNDAAKKTWYEANEMCTSAGYRLCNNQEELNRCCKSGCKYDRQLVWTSMELGITLRAAHAPPPNSG